MAGLIYPAVLGNIIYLIFQAFERLGTSNALEPSKFGLLALTAAFYLCDYMYLIFTKQFGLPFFVLDGVFVALLFVTIHFIGVGQTDTGQFDAPNVCGIASLYALFMFLYFLWDFYEFQRCKSQPSPCAEQEKRFYLKIFVWEGLSFAAFISVLVIPKIRNTAALSVALLVVTIAFAVILVPKGRYYKR